MPGNSAHFLKTLLDVTRLNFIDLSGFVRNVFGFSDSLDGLNPVFFQSGYDSHLALVNLGVLTGIAILLLAAWLIMFVVQVVLNKLKGTEEKSETKLEPWACNFFVRFAYLAFLEFTLCSLINLAKFTNETGSELLSGLYAVLLLVCVVAFMLFNTALFFIVKVPSTQGNEKTKIPDSETIVSETNRVQTDKSAVQADAEEIVSTNPEFKVNSRFETAYLGLNTKHKIRSTLYPTSFLTRRFLYCLTAVLLQHRPLAQIILIGLQSLYMLVILTKYRPFDDPNFNRLQVFNEACIFVAICHLYWFTDYVVDYETRFLIGWSLIALVLVCILVNSGLMLHRALRTLYYAVLR